MESWQQKAACRGLPSDWFVTSLSEWELERAKEVCARCPVRAQCQALGDEVEVGFPLIMLEGVWGGEGPRERAIRRSPNTQVFPAEFRRGRRRGPRPLAHGNPNTYTKLKCRCFWCCDAHRIKMKVYRRKLREGRLRKYQPSHGNVTCYRRGCRRDECVAAHAKDKQYRDRLKRAATQTGATVQCKWCLKTEVVTDERSKRRIYCSEACYSQARNERRRKKAA